MPDPYHLIISPEAAEDMQALHAHIAQGSPDNAAKMVERILAAIEELSAFPHRTVAQHVSPKMRQPVRSLPVRPYVVYFRVTEDPRTVRILSVRHGARRPPRSL